VDCVGDIDCPVVVRVAGIVAFALSLSTEQRSQSEDCIGDVDRAVVVAVAAQAGRLVILGKAETANDRVTVPVPIRIAETDRAFSTPSCVSVHPHSRIGELTPASWANRTKAIDELEEMVSVDSCRDGSHFSRRRSSRTSTPRRRIQA